MPVATIPELKRFIGDSIDDLDDPTLQMFLDDAKASVIGQGVSESHARFAELQRCMCGNLLFCANRIPNEIMAESVDGISVNYDTNIAPG
ncbi:MAG: hypothetical protein K8R21_04005, partial [Leptospira sp.]|nr:hypothetical protein [Leptospira sp.]